MQQNSFDLQTQVTKVNKRPVDLRASPDMPALPVQTQGLYIKHEHNSTPDSPEKYGNIKVTIGRDGIKKDK